LSNLNSLEVNGWLLQAKIVEKTSTFSAFTCLHF